jgi:hypothetical protein
MGYVCRLVGPCVGEVQPLTYIYVLQPLVSIEQSFSLSNSYDTCFLSSSQVIHTKCTIPSIILNIVIKIF